MRLVEISFAANVPFEWVRQSPEHCRADFESQGRRYFVDFYTGNWDGTPCWMFQFGIYQSDKESSTMRMTKLKNPYSVLSTVKAVFDDFMQRKHPACLAFYDGDRIPSRMRWYQQFATYVINRYGYRQDDAMMQKAMRTLTRSPDTFIWILKRGRQDEASGQRIALNFDTLYGKAFKVTDPEGDPQRQGFSIISRIANGSVWNEWQERPQFKAIVRQRLNDPGFLADYKYQQIVDSAKQLGLLQTLSEAAMETAIQIVPVLYHGTCEDSAAHLMQHGWQPHSGMSGGNQGQSRYLYLSTDHEDALWFAQEKGCDTVLAVRNIPRDHLIVDPEDGIGDTVEAELHLSHGLPGKLALIKPLPASHFQADQT